MSSDWWFALGGGALIGLASAFLLFTLGRVAGISGIVGSLLPPVPSDRAWRLAFVGGLLAAGLVGRLVAPTAIGTSVVSPTLVLAAGVLVGFGTRLGSGCTSGHGVCGLARGSARSLVAVMVFMATGVITASLVGGGS